MERKWVVFPLMACRNIGLLDFKTLQPVLFLFLYFFSFFVFIISFGVK